MWFKNARLFRFTKPFDIDPEELEQKLEAAAFKPCGPQEAFRQGWVSPLGRKGQQHVHSAGGYHLIALRREERVLPATVVREAVDEQVEQIETEQVRKVARKEKQELKDQLTQELLPRAFTKSRRTFAYLAPKDGLLIVDASSDKQAEELASELRRAIGSLPVRPPAVEQAPAFTFSGWLNESIDLPGAFSLGTECELKDTSEEGGVVRCKGLDLRGDEIRNHLEAGMQVTKLALGWEDALTFVLDEDLALKRLKFGDTIQEKLDDIDTDDDHARFDAAFNLMTLELARLIPTLLEAMGGEDRSAIVDAA
ncbi:recombination-associated protein RdgC [Tamilnaduibacter salinus]|uniref:Recombination-associated protein RdgC n=1 Tax=Tamilnaduibacter salinus TaxID=1484056 RepID=A0A2A2I4Z2_9GAMM|nr:recombination-associated protein RdgC [Tamilnaduibacter salinus]PAV26652.1 recombination-associated protein RdgC [Tamilnaduibacter salinus]